MEVISRNEPNNATPFQHDPNYLALSRMLARYQNLILLTPSPDAKLDARLVPWQKQIQAELWSPLPFHRMKWLRSIEGARSLLLKLEQSAQSIKVQRTRREVVKNLAEKRMVIKRLRSRVEEIGREVEATGTNGYTSQYEDDEESETMYDVLQQTRKNKAQPQSDDGQDAPSQQNVPVDKSQRESTSLEQEGGTARQQLFDSTSTMRRRQGKEEFNGSSEQGTTSGFSNLPQTEQSLLASSKEHENITSSLLSMAAQLKQQAKQFEFTLDQDKGLVDRALEGLDSNVAAMGIASKGMKTLQRMSEEQGFFGRLKLQLFIVAIQTKDRAPAATTSSGGHPATINSTQSSLTRCSVVSLERRLYLNPTIIVTVTLKMATNLATVFIPSQSTVTSTPASAIPFSRSVGSCNVYKWAVGIETCVIGVTMVVCLMFFYIKSGRWMRKGAASKDPEIGDLKKELEEYKAIALKNAR
ncbi:hypothetical protein LTR24_001225 [Lithohypha guttulata]|uniref:Uncharacterized protein n=1 Tax=Lithohypha guttulata TaxID=1690604 RepID=A0ABR0KKZ8_9EURO|nr:hypothetical protein LTR24_001225 [Lithohypha guttulata]